MEATKYVHAYFRIEAGYEWGRGMSQDAATSFDKKLSAMFAPLGFSPVQSDISGGCVTMHRGKESLYCHPMDLSGYILPESIPAIRAACPFHLRTVDIVHEAYDYTPEQMTQRLAELKPELVEAYKRAYTTKRRNLGKTLQGDGFLSWLRKRSDWIIESDNDKAAKTWLWQIFDELIQSGDILRIGETKWKAAIYRTNPKALEAAHV